MAKRDRVKKAGGTNERSKSPMNLDLLEQITRLMRDNDLNTLDVRDGDKRVILKRGIAVPNTSPGMMPHSVMHHMTHQNPGLASGAASAPATASAQPEADAGMVTIKSPMVGTFYSSSSPDAKPFVSVGSVVDEDTDVCIIEAMKVFNNIKAEIRGTIQKIVISNGETVEFGQPLFLVKPA